MPDKPPPDMNGFIPGDLDDRVFYYAHRVIRGPGQTWSIFVEPDACLVGMSDEGGRFPTLNEMRNGGLQRSSSGEQVVYDGRILFSGGVILTVNNKILMLLRDENASVDPLKWTSPAGRCDKEPLLTSLKEFYEEVILFDRRSGHPIFVTFLTSPYDGELKKIYSKTLNRKGFDPQVRQWTVAHAAVNEDFNGPLHSVETRFGPDRQIDPSRTGNIFTGDFFTYFDEENNTLELRLVADLSLPPGMVSRLAFCDGEYEREVRLFNRNEFMQLKKTDLVGTMAYYRDMVLCRSWRIQRPFFPPGGAFGDPE